MLLPSPGVFVPGLAPVVPAAHAVELPVAASVHGLPELAAGEGLGQGLVSERFHHPAAVAASAGQPERPAGAALNAEAPADVDFLPEDFPAFPAEQVQAFSALPAA